MLVNACAKINLFLRVLSRRPDGYHTIETIYQTVSLADTLEFAFVSEINPPELVLSPDSSSRVSTDDSNIVLKVVKSLEEYADIKIEGLRIRLTKHIPVGAGLGGGSADAAATLTALNRLCSLALGQDILCTIAESVGSDVPFLLQGGTARGEGRGEILVPLTSSLKYHVVIVFPGFPINTGMAYECVDKVALSRAQPPHSSDSLAEALKHGAYADFCTSIWNDFDDVMSQEYPEVRRIREMLLEAGCDAAQLSGSGSAVFGICETKDRAESVCNVLKGHYAHVHVAEPTAQSLTFEE